MDGISHALTILGMFLVRLAAPLAITLAVGYLLRRLDARWEAELRSQQPDLAAPAPAEIRQSQGATGQRSVSPRPDQLPQAGLPVIPVLAEPAGKDVYGPFCWDVRQCDPARRQQCPAFHQPGSPCWVARRQAEGQIPRECYHCELFVQPQAPESLFQ